MFLCHKWGETAIKWNTARFKWSECELVGEVLGGFQPGVPGDLAVPPWLREEEPYSPYEKDKRERFIRLLCKVKNETYSEEKKVREDIKVTIEDVALVVRTVSGIDILAK